MKSETTGVRHEDAYFFGRIAAGLTHELKNVLAIINETGGLVEDLLDLGAGDNLQYKERFQKALKTILAQTKRGLELTNRFNRFAHSADSALEAIDCGQWVEQIVFLSRRFARLREVDLEVMAAAAPVEETHIETDPFLFQMALFTALDCLMDVAGPGGKVTVQWRCGQQGLDVRFLSAPGESKGDPQTTGIDVTPCLSGVQEASGPIGGTVSWKAGEGVLDFRFPRSLGAGPGPEAAG